MGDRTDVTLTVLKAHREAVEDVYVIGPEEASPTLLFVSLVLATSTTGVYGIPINLLNWVSLSMFVGGRAVNMALGACIYGTHQKGKAGALK